ncbi:MAG: class I SAM-dependent methyltransferase [Deltaproteobacteria bacterium]
MTAAHVSVYDSLGSDYERAFGVFLAHTDQKDKAWEWLDQEVGRLAARRQMVDAGAGTGKVTAWFAPRFERTIAIEPNPHLRRHLEVNCPAAEIVPGTILDCALDPLADFVLASHIFYYIPAADWQANLERLASFLAPGGTLVVVLQNAGTDCMGLVDHFHGRQFNLKSLARDFQSQHDGQYDCRVETVESHVTTGDAAAAYTVAEFMLNLLPIAAPPLRSALDEYVRREFAAPNGGYRFTCSQDFLAIRRR